MDFGFFDWRRRFQTEGLTYGLRMELFDLLKPHVRVRAPLRLPDSDLSSGLPSDESAIRALVDWEIVLGTDEVHQTIAELSTSERWQASLPELLSGFSSLLRDAMDLSRQLQGADDRADGSYWHQPSIKAHDQNRKFRDWTALIELTRDSWLATALQDPRKARAEVHHWLTFPYPLFRRLAFFAATETNLFEPNLALSWLLDNEGWWLWSVETERETFRLLKRLAHQLGAHEVRSFVSAILSGPPRSMYQADISAERLSQIADREIWLRLAKFQASGGRLEANASSALSSISARYPDLVLADDESDEFPVWMGPIRDFGGKQVAIPRELDALKSWLRTESAEGVATSVEWSQLCKDDLDTASTALTDLAAEGLWPEAQWRAAFQAWSDPTIAELSWDRMRDVVTELPDSILEDIVQSVSWWLQTVAKLLKNGEGAFLSIAERLIVAQRQKGYDRDEDPLFHAINHPVGQTTDAVLRWWYRQDLKDGQLLRPEVSKIFNVICNLDVDAFRYGRIVLAANVIPLFRVDRLWTVANILPNLNWSRNLEEARAQWSGFLWSPRLYPSLYACIKSEFLSTAAHYQELGELAHQYATLLTYIALEDDGTFTRRELAAATEQLPSDGLLRCVSAVVQAIETAGEKKLEYWTNRINPYLHEIWPKTVAVITPQISNMFARLCTESGEAFPSAVDQLRPWLSRSTHSDTLLLSFGNTQLPNRFPEAALKFLDGIVPDESAFFLPDNLKSALNTIRNAAPRLADDQRFQRLAQLLRLRGG